MNIRFLCVFLQCLILCGGTLVSEALEERSMKILVVEGPFPTLSGTFILNQITGLLERGHDVYIYSKRRGDVSKVHRSYEKHNLLARTYYHELPDDLDTYDIILCQFANLVNPFIALKQQYRNQGKTFRPKLVTCLRGEDVTKYILKKRPFPQSLYEECDLLLPVCDYYKRGLKNLGCSSDKIKVLRSSIDCDKFTSKPRVPPSDNVFHIVSTGRLVEMKGFKYSILAVKKLLAKGYKVKYTIIGGGENEKKLRSFVRGIRQKDAIELVGWKTAKEILNIYDQAHIFVLPSVTTSSGAQEGIPNVLKEAMVFGMPVVSTRHAGIPELIEDGITGFLVPERDVNALASKIEYLINHPATWEPMGLAGRKKVQETYDIEQLSNELEQTLLEICPPPLPRKKEEAIAEKPFVFIVPSYNNAQWYKWNLDSIFSQKYQNYRVIYIDDCSPDGTADLVEQYVKEKGQEHRFTLIRNKERSLQLANRYKAIQSCADNEIMALLDGDDFMSDSNALQIINKAYQDPNVWLTYAQYKRWCKHCKLKPYPEVVRETELCEHKKGYSWREPIPVSDIEANSIRQNGINVLGGAVHFRTFYAWLYKQIKIEDLLIDGNFFPRGTENATMYPLVELAGKHTKFIPEIVMIFNRENALNITKIRKENYDLYFKLYKGEIFNLARFVRLHRSLYQPLQEPYYFDDVAQKARVLLFIFSSNQSKSLRTLRSVETFVKGTDSIAICTKHQDSNGDLRSNDYDVLDDSLKTIRSYLEKNQFDYVFFLSDDNLFKDCVDVKKTAKLLETTHAYAFYFSVDKSLARGLSQSYFPVFHEVCGWQYQYEIKNWISPNDSICALYRVEDVRKICDREMSNDNMLFSQVLKFHSLDTNRVGLFFETSKVIK